MALTLAKVERMLQAAGAVYIDLPAEIINTPVEQDEVLFPAPVGDPPRTQGDPCAIEEALRVLRNAERPRRGGLGNNGDSCAHSASVGSQG